MRSAASRNVLALAVALIGIVLPLSFAAAQTQPPSPLSPGGTAPTQPGTVNCFDYYHFGSVQVDVTPGVASTVSGVPITFTGTIKNENPYPVVDGSVYVKIFRERGNGEKDSNGPDVVDQFYAADNLTIPADGQLPISINWNIPAYAASGQYKIATFFTVSHKFNLLGLPFTDDIVGNTAGFKVSGEQKSVVGFKKDAVTVGGEQYHFAAFPPREDAAAPITVEAYVANPTAEIVTVPVTWTLNTWSGNDDANVITTRTDQVTIPAGGQTKFSFVASDARLPVYLLTGVLKWKDTSSIINVRFARGGKDRLRINFPAVTSFPLRSGEETTLFSCLHNAGASAAVPDSRLELSLLDKTGRTIHSYAFTGDVTGAMMGVAEKFVPRKTYGTFTLAAKLYQGGTLVDESSVIYDCESLDPSLCEKKGAFAAQWPVVLAAFAALAALAYAARRMKTPREKVP